MPSVSYSLIDSNFIRSVISVTGGVIGLLSEEETNMQECEEYTV